MAVLAVSVASAHPVGESALDRAEAKVDEVARELETARSRADGAQEELARADARLREVEAAVNEVAREVGRQQEKVADAEAELERLQAEAAGLEESFETRAVSLFKTGGGDSLELLLSSGDLQTAMDRSSYLRVLSAGDVANLEMLRASRTAVQEQRGFLEEEQAYLEEVLARREALLERVERIRDDKAMAAARAREQVDDLEEHRDDLESEVHRIEELIEEQRRRAGSAPAPMPGGSGFVWPACGGVTSEYGYRWGRLHAGIDIDDPPSWIRAARSGVVIFVGYEGGYGRLTLIDHGDGTVTAYAHQSAQNVSPGQSVVRGEQIGMIGSTGFSTGPHLHFEVRVNGAPVNPRQYLPAGGC